MFPLAQSPSSSYFQRYRSTALRFEIIGGALLVAGLLINTMFSGPALIPSLLLVAVGGGMFVLGGSSRKPHNIVKAFARQLLQTPSDEFAQGLLEALELRPKLRLLASSIQVVQAAVELYASSDEADPELAEQLQQALATRVVKKML